MAVPDPNLLDLLINEKNVAGLWAVIGTFIAALMTFVGIFFNNFQENKRKRIEREKRIIFESYIGAIQYISNSHVQLLKAGTGQVDEVSNAHSTSMEKFYNLSLVASPEVVDLFLKLSTMYSSAFFSVSGNLLDLQAIKPEIELQNNLIELASKQVERALSDMKTYNDNKETDAKKFSIYQTQFDKYSSDRDNFSATLETLHKNNATIKLSLLKEVHLISSNITPHISSLIILMRGDIERKMDKSGMQIVKKSFDDMNSTLSKNTMNLIQTLNQKIESLMTDEKETV